MLLDGLLASHILREESEGLVDSIFVQVLENGTIYSMVTDNMDRATISNVYPRNLKTTLWQTEGGVHLISVTVRAQVRITVSAEYETQKTLLEVSLDAKLPLQKTAVQGYVGSRLRDALETGHAPVVPDGPNTYLRPRGHTL